MWTSLGYTIGAEIHLHQSRSWHWSANAWLNAPYIAWFVHYQYTGEYSLNGRSHERPARALALTQTNNCSSGISLGCLLMNTSYLRLSVLDQESQLGPIRASIPSRLLAPGTMVPFNNQQSCVEVRLASHIKGTIWIYPFLCNLITTCAPEPCLSIITCENPKICVRVEADPRHSCEHTLRWRRIYFLFNNIWEVTWIVAQLVFARGCSHVAVSSRCFDQETQLGVTRASVHPHLIRR